MNTKKKSTSFGIVLGTMAALFVLSGKASAQVNSGSDGHDGAFNPTANITINMADHPDGICQYTSVNIPAGITVTFTPNTNNTPVVWLVQSNCVIGGVINLDGKSSADGGGGGAGGFAGGASGNANVPIPGGNGFGPGGGMGAVSRGYFGSFWGGSGSHVTTGNSGSNGFEWQAAPGSIYGNIFCVPLLGGSGGGGGSECGAGGGGAILIAASGSITLAGGISANGGSGTMEKSGGGASGGAVRLVATYLTGTGSISAVGGSSRYYNSPFYYSSSGGDGRIRLDSLVNTLYGSGQFSGNISIGFQPIIIPVPAQQTHLAISSLAGIAVPENFTGTLLNPAVIIPGQQANPVPVVVQCSNIPLNTTITVEVHPAIGATVTAAGLNDMGTQASSTASIPVNMPRGGGVILATAVTPITFASNDNGKKFRSLAKTGWTADGETFEKMELSVAPGGKQRIVYLTESGKRYPLSPL